MALAVVAIAAELDQGKMPRSDAFFDPDGRRPPAAEELFEGVLLKARDAYEERKLPLLANLYSSFVFTNTISPTLANSLVELAGRLTYQQLVFMAVALDQERRQRLRNASYAAGAALQRMDSNAIGLLTEVYSLHHLGLVHDVTSGTWISVGNVNPAGTRLQGSGWILADAMKRSTTIPAEEKDAVVSQLSDPD